ncbi:hypothetical protein BOX15_Mlig033431g2 [Macrostomum lignano]|uniref:Uncharacterized protein n=1 Tax=Macrostomum lignano TaxID=282301 RepID=A0A267G2E9_9PLAT|nr:hypothetical protein BOX15_Mlig033431g3 [Macrostomum lignano]PAA84637.1 hypothetical protein BOX15_Mlig033431g2 [Macrostomum lignano]
MENPNPPLRRGKRKTRISQAPQFSDRDDNARKSVDSLCPFSSEEKSYSQTSTDSLTSTNSTLIHGESLNEKYSGGSDKTSLVLVTFCLQDLYKSHVQHYNKLEFIIRQRFGKLVDVRRKEGPTNAGFDVYIGITSSSKSERLVFSRIIEGVFPQADALLGIIERTIADKRVEERELSKVQCCFIYSDQEHTSIFKRLVNQATSQLIGRIKFNMVMVPIKDVLEVWINGQLVYSLWYCGQPPVLHDLIAELQKASIGHPFETMPRMRS